MRRSLALATLLSAIAPGAQAAVVGGSNINLTDYPAPSCTRPQTIAQPEKPADTKDKAAVDAFNKKVEVYNAKVAVFNTAMHAFNDCMKTYVDNANSDMQRIKQAVDASQPAAH